MSSQGGVSSHRCTARRNDGESCRNSPMRGTQVCRVHAAPEQLQTAAKQALKAAHRRFAAAGRL